MGSALITTGGKPGEGAPARIEPIESAMSSLESLAGLEGVADDPNGHAAADEPTDETAGRAVDGSELARIVREWEALKESERRNGADTTIQIADVADCAGEERSAAFSVLSQYAMLALDEKAAPCADVLGVIGSVVGGGPHLKAFQRVFRLIDRVAEGMRALPSKEPQFVLALAWDVTGVAEHWQRMALKNTPEGRAANDRLDAAMRLFQYAQGGMIGTDIDGFIDQVRSMEIEADSLAKTGAGGTGRDIDHAGRRFGQALGVRVDSRVATGCVAESCRTRHTVRRRGSCRCRSSWRRRGATLQQRARCAVGNGSRQREEKLSGGDHPRCLGDGQRRVERRYDAIGFHVRLFAGALPT